MAKYKVLDSAVLAVEKDSIVIVSEEQYKRAKHLLRPYVEVEKAVAPRRKKEKAVEKE